MCQEWSRMTREEAKNKVLALVDGERPTSAIGVVQLEAFIAQELAQNAQEGVEYLLKKDRKILRRELRRPDDLRNARE